MIVISHRGNQVGQVVENNPDKLPLDKFVCEIDLWRVNTRLFLGHDKPEYEININWLRYWNPRLFIHAKNIEALLFLKEFKYAFGFWHQEDDYALTIPDCRIIVYPGKALVPNGIVMKPELYSWDDVKSYNPFAIVTDYPDLY